MSILQIKDLTKTYDNREILKNIDLTINEGDRIGVVGLNGAGKSTLFKIIAEETEIDSGKMIRKNDIRIGILDQIPTLPEKQTIQEALEESVSYFKNIHHELSLIETQLTHSQQPSLLERQAELHQLLDISDGWQYMRKVEEVLSKLQLYDHSATIATLSTGLKKRVALAKILVQNPEFLLLDEPTNHLDTESIDWLEKWILQFKGTCLFVTHDRYFLDRLATRIIEIDQARLYQHNGNYSTYLEAKETREAQNHNRIKKLNKLLQIEIDFSRQGVKARRTKPKYRETKMDTLQEEKDQVQTHQTIQLQFKSSNFANNVLLELEDLAAGYQKPLFQDLTMQIRPGTITGIIGRNGIGKSTLLKVIDGEIPPLKGSVKKSKGLSIGVFSQNFENLDLESSLLKNTRNGSDYFMRGNNRYRIDQLLEDLLFSPRDFGRKLKDFSGGEKARASLAHLIARGANLLLFDEPTNNLDLPTLQALEALLLDFDGAVLVVTHDRYFLDKIADEIIYFHEGSASLFKGNYSSFLEQVNLSSKVESKNTTKSTTSEKPRNRENRISNQEKRELTKIEKEIETLEKEVEKLSLQLQDPQTYQNAEQAKQLGALLKDKQTLLANLMQRWETLAEKL